MDFIKLFDADNEGKVSHMEGEKVKGSKVYKDKTAVPTKNSIRTVTIELMESG